MLRLTPVCQKYAWGKIGNASTVAQLFPGEVVDTDPYAELWMGTHPNGPSTVMTADGKTITLEDHVGGGLPYLFKVLSVNKALSIQAHPDLKLAEQLHRERPHIYKDPNHKPELALALTNFEAMCGFRTVDQIKHHLRNVPELCQVVTQSQADAFLQSSPGDKKALQTLFTAYISATPEVLQTASAQLRERFSKMEPTNQNPAELDLTELVVRLCGQYPNDVGIFAPFFLNCVRLQPGQAIFLPASEPHAYLDGDCLEAMACSDNVIRAGLTPKLIDKDTLIAMLSYNTGPVDVLAGNSVDSSTRVYVPPVNEFAVSYTEVSANQAYTLEGKPGCSILLVVRGSAALTQDDASDSLVRGNIVVTTSDSSIQVTAGSEGLTLARCFYPGQPATGSAL